MDRKIKTPSDFLNQVSPGMIGIREQLGKSGLDHVVCSLLHMYSNHINEGIIEENISLRKELEEAKAKIAELESKEEKFRNFIRANHLSASWIEFINQP